MKCEEYRALLGRLPIKCPTPQDMATLCPHLTPEEAVKTFTSGSGSVACPPRRVRGSYHVVSLRKEWVEEIKVWRGDTRVITGRKNHPAELVYSCTRRMQPAGGSNAGYQDVDEAMRFAEDHWGSELVADTWESVVEIYIQDPTDLVTDGYHTDYPRTKAVLMVTLSRELNVIINEHHRPQSELFDDAVVEMTLDQFVGNELKGECGGYTEFNCAHCGHGLSLDRCHGCGYRFRDDHFRYASPL